MNRRMVLIILIAASLLIVPLILTAAQKTVVAPTEVVLREGPGSYFKVTGTISKGTKCTVIQQAGVWYYLKIDDEERGYASKKSWIGLNTDEPGISSADDFSR